ncbi:MAG: flagellar biosynthetic protein FliO, partial [Proteobacteria bacterium]|nr:flagellar biosynthetic protein FliO [Pseudomonadota bacterium]
INVVTSMPLGPKKMVSVVNVAGKYMVLGVGPESVNFLTNIDDAQALEKLEKSVLKAKSGKFRNVLNFQKGGAKFNFTKLLKLKARDNE